MHFRAIISLGNNLFARKVSKSIFTVFANLGSSPYKDRAQARRVARLSTSLFGHLSGIRCPRPWPTVLGVRKSIHRVSTAGFCNWRKRLCRSQSTHIPTWLAYIRRNRHSAQEASVKCTSSKTILIW